jgi:hypothetical protein
MLRESHIPVAIDKDRHKIDADNGNENDNDAEENSIK